MPLFIISNQFKKKCFLLPAACLLLAHQPPALDE
jgi:hypothetical protein